MVCLKKYDHRILTLFFFQVGLIEIVVSHCLDHHKNVKGAQHKLAPFTKHDSAILITSTERLHVLQAMNDRYVRRKPNTNN